MRICCSPLAKPPCFYYNSASRREITRGMAAITGGFMVSSALCFENTSPRLDMCWDRCEC